METFAKFETETDNIERKKIVLDEKEYANICLNCERSRCLLEYRHKCPIISKYKYTPIDSYSKRFEND